MVHLLLGIIYLAFISLGLPDSLLGSAWPSMYGDFGVPVSFAGIVSMIIAVGTVVSSLQSDRLTRRLGAGKVTALSVGMTAAALLGFSASGSFWMLCLWAVPYGLGAGSVDAALNNYVALHYASRHMSWLHCMWGVGTIVGPYVIGMALTNGWGWGFGYRSLGIVQLALTAVLLLSLPLWKKRNAPAPEHAEPEPSGGQALPLRKVVRLPGAKEVMVTFFCYCAVEQTVILWGGSYLVLQEGMTAETAAFYASLFFIGITAGRAVCGFLTMKFSDRQMVRFGQVLIAAGALSMLLPFGSAVTLLGLMLVGLGCAPIYPCLIHSTPAHFGAGQSQAIIGVQMASAYVGTCLMPPLFGLIAEHLTVALFPAYLLGALALMAVMHELLLKKTGRAKPSA